MDAVESIVRLMDARSAVGQVFNVGNDQEITIEGLAELVKATIGSDSPIQKVPYSEAYPLGFEDMARRVPDVRKLERFIGYRPRTPLETIVADVIAEKKAALGLK